MKLKLQTLAGNHQVHYLTGKQKMFNATVNVSNFLQKFSKQPIYQFLTKILSPST